MLAQTELQLNKFDGMYATNPNDVARSTNDNMLDIVDIVNNDPALAAAAGDVSVANNGAQPNQTFAASTGGFGEFAGYLNGVGGVNDHGGTSFSTRTTRRKRTSGRNSSPKGTS